MDWERGWKQETKAVVAVVLDGVLQHGDSYVKGVWREGHR